MTTQEDFEKLQEMAKQEPWLGFELAKVEGQVKGKDYPFRDEIPEHLLNYADWFVKATGLEPDSRTISDWKSELDYWHSKGFTTWELDQARKEMTGLIYRPGTITSTAQAIKAQKRQQFHNPKIFRASEQPEHKYTPMPDDMRRRIELALGKSAHEPTPIGDVIKDMNNG